MGRANGERMTKPTTRLLADRGQILSELQLIRPKRIAVAYVGAAWSELLGTDRRLEEIVVSPTAGTNPWAVERIAEEVGWENVHFLDTLHAKIYLGSRRAMFGSANLSSNALAAGGTHLYEMVAVTSDSKLRKLLNDEYGRYRSLAIGAYRSIPAKKARIRTLKQVQTELEAARIRLTPPKAPTLADFEVGSIPVHLEWWQEVSPAGGDVDDTDYINLRIGGRRSEVQVGHWMLEWRCTPTGSVGKRFELDWMRIDAVRYRGAKGEPVFIDQVAERVEPRRHEVPFVLDARVKHLFKTLVMEREDLRPTRPNDAMPTPSLRTVKAFLTELKARYVRAV